MKKIILLNKKEGETPLESLGVFRSKNKKYKDIKMTYAGRLDPMASGLLLCLTGDEVNQKEKYLKLNKEYEFQILFNFSTDTYDILGKVTKVFYNKNLLQQKLEKEIKNNLKYFIGKFIKEYPMYSSKTVKGKSLFIYAREGINVEIPKREIEIKSLKFLNIKKIKKEKLLKDIQKRIKKVKGDFRQKEILKIWENKLNYKNIPKQFFLANFKIKCSSGTYVRSIANSLGKKMNIPTLAYSIKRTKIGKYAIIKE